MAGLVVGLGAAALAPVAASAQSWSSTQFERRQGGEDELQVQVRYGAGSFRLSPLDGALLYRARLRYDEDAVEPTHAFASGVLRVGVSSLTREGRPVSMRRGSDHGELDLGVGRNVPVRLDLSLGAVKAEVELGGLRLRDLAFATGASETEVGVGARNPESMESARFQVGAAAFEARELGRLRARELNVEAGVGDVRLNLVGLEEPLTSLRVTLGLGALAIEVPQGVGIQLTRSSFLSTLDAPGLERQGNTWVSANWESAAVRLSVEIESALGSVTVRRVP